MDIPKKMTITSRLTGEVVVFDIQGEFSRVTAEAPTLSELVKSQLGTGKRRDPLRFRGHRIRRQLRHLGDARQLYFDP